MKVVLNKCFGGFVLSDYVADLLDVNPYCDPDDVRYSPQLVAYVEAFGSKRCSGIHADLKVIEIPDTYTDIELNEYDGIEFMTYVVNGKIYHA